jgi:beta-galactosidase
MHLSDNSQETKLKKRVAAMWGSSFFKSVSKVSSTLTLALVICLPLSGQAEAADVVETYKDASGWKLQVNGSDYYVKGVVWGYSPRGQNYSYNLWAESDDFIRKVLDYDMGLLKAAGVNTIRTFSMVPPKWVTYIYQEHGIMSVVNPLMGRYGYSINGRWVPFTDYSDSLTRATLLKDTLEIVDEYKNTPGVLMFAFGNESNYGLSWSSFEIENLPEGEQNTAKARYLYSLFNEVMAAGKKIAPNHPFTIVNGDIQYIDLIAELCKDMDLLGVNAYRGKSFTGLWRDVDEKLDLPVVFFEFGSDAFNAREFEEDQVSQALLLKDQWQEMYNKAAGNGEEGNSIGGFVFEFRDEWWKYLQIENLDIQDNNASWSNQGYMFDWAEGKNNMNEEWFGIAALGPKNSDGVYTARPRMAYDVLSEIWHLDPYKNKKAAFNQSINNMNMEFYALKGEVRMLKSESKEDKQKLSFNGGSVRAEMVVKGQEIDITENGENGTEFSDGQMLFLDLGFQPADNFDGQLTINILGNVADKEPLEIEYGRRGLPFSIKAESNDEVIEGAGNANGTYVFESEARVEIYDFDATYQGDNFDLTAFYHTPRYHWKNEGDFFGLVREATDIAGMDIWNAKAPEGVEFAGKGKLDGLKIIAGPEVYWGANPKVVLKYEKTIGKIDWAFMHAEDLARRDQGTGAAGATERKTRQTTLYAKRDFANEITLEVGGLMSAVEKVDDSYTRWDGQNVILDQIDFEDTLGFRAKLSFPLFGTRSYVSTYHAGLVADGGDVLKDFGISDPTGLPYSSQGNKREVEAGMMINFGDFMVYPRAMYRDNLVDANPFIPPSINGGILNPGTQPRDTDKDPFAVLGNREARSAEVFLTYDPTGASFFYDWDNEWKEDAKFAFNIGGNYTEYPTFTDAYLFYFLPGRRNASFGEGLPSEYVWSVSSRMVFNPNYRAKYILNLKSGKQQSTGNPNGGTRKFHEIHGKAVWANTHVLSGYFKKDAWGPYDFQRQFNVTFPEQYKIDYQYFFDGGANQFIPLAGGTTSVGIRALYRTNDPNAIVPSGYEEQGDYIFQTVAYFTYRF